MQKEKNKHSSGKHAKQVHPNTHDFRVSKQTFSSQT